MTKYAIRYKKEPDTFIEFIDNIPHMCDLEDATLFKTRKEALEKIQKHTDLKNCVTTRIEIHITTS